jgi:ERCC4-type nuclease
LILYSARQIKSFATGAFQRYGSRPKGRRKKQLFILQGLPGVGSERAIRLLEAFGSVEAVITATGEELQSVEGIGKHISENIRWAVSEQIKPFGFID